MLRASKDLHDTLQGAVHERKPAARVTDPTACPLPGHGTNPIVSGSPNVNFGLAAARMTDKCACGSAISGAVSGTVFINGLNAATLDSTGGHGNVVIGGSGTVIIGDTVVVAPADAGALHRQVETGQRCDR